MKNHAKTVLLVEDEALIAMNEAAMLKKHGYEVVTAYNAEQGVETVRRKSPDLILMDIDLGKGKMDGTEAAEIILKEKEVPIVFLTSHAEKEYVDRVKNITGYGYVLKNSGEFVLIESITMAFHLFQAHQTEKANRLRLITIYNQASAGIAQVRADGTFIEANQKFCDIIGYIKKEVIEVSISDITAPEDLAAENVYIQEVLDGIKDSYSIEKRYIHKTGRPVWVQLESNVVRNLKGDPLYAIAVVIDITCRKETEKALAESEERYRTLFNESIEGVFIHELDGRIIDVNKRACEQTGYSREELLELQIFDLHSKAEDSRNLPKNEIKRLWKQWKPGERYTLEADHVHKNGTIFPVQISTGPVLLGNRCVIMAIVEDLSGREQG